MKMLYRLILLGGTSLCALVVFAVAGSAATQSVRTLEASSTPSPTPAYLVDVYISRPDTPSYALRLAVVQGGCATASDQDSDEERAITVCCRRTEGDEVEVGLEVNLQRHQDRLMSRQKFEMAGHVRTDGAVRTLGAISSAAFPVTMQVALHKQDSGPSEVPLVGRAPSTRRSR